MDLKNVRNDLLAGSIAGAAGIAVGHPLDVIKVRQQAQMKVESTSKIFMDTVKQEGPVALFRGMVAPLLSQGAYTALAFMGFNTALAGLTGHLGSDLDTTPLSYTFLAGCAGGSLTTFVTTPCDIVKINLQVDHSKLGLGGVRKLIRNRIEAEGLRGMFGGWSMTFLRDSPSSGLYFLMYYESKDFFLSEVNGNRTAAELLSGGLAGVVSWGSVIPIDVVKTRIQVDVCSPPTERQYRSARHCAQEILAKEGYGGFFKGAGPILLRAFPVNAVTFFAYERCMDRLQKF